MTNTARRMHELLEPICMVSFASDECNEELAALGHRSYWDGYFASRAAPLGRVPAEVVHAAFYNFADGEVARHIPSAWETIPPEASVAARRRGSAASLRRILGDELTGSPGLARAADLTTQAAASAPTAGRMMYAGMRTLPVPNDPVERLWQSATTLREHRGDGHIAALVGARIGGAEAHVLAALEMGIHPPESFGRVHHLPKRRLAAIMAGLRERGIVDVDGRFTDAGRETKDRIEALTDELAAAPYEGLSAAEFDELVTLLEPITARLVATGSE
ncbi:MarR family transcriptional regulator [Amycolatopsis rhabdoformis]|uniref:MarR family transcriptional regulator n=2 Tax=Amycolatopsis rhabdoformis TaxID=1448059 RepID=A0ABZ1IB34_9PSEU|nr:MarR family transcriptional regulator [Amycolatopsis rhabdoformis]WSE30655.1 MarR family transcriptional regulator [Amycolatopsis rhabdoformis]